MLLLGLLELLLLMQNLINFLVVLGAGGVHGRAAGVRGSGLVGVGVWFAVNAFQKLEAQ